MCLQGSERGVSWIIPSVVRGCELSRCIADGASRAHCCIACDRSNLQSEYHRLIEDKLRVYDEKLAAHRRKQQQSAQAPPPPAVAQVAHVVQQQHIAAPAAHGGGVVAAPQQPAEAELRSFWQGVSAPAAAGNTQLVLSAPPTALICLRPATSCAWVHGCLQVLRHVHHADLLRQAKAMAHDRLRGSTALPPTASKQLAALVTRIDHCVRACGCAWVCLSTR